MKIIAALAAIAAISTQSAAQGVALPCGPADAVEQQLRMKHGETKALSGTNASGWTLNVWTNERAATYTVTVTRPDGLLCVISAGVKLKVMKGA